MEEVTEAERDWRLVRARGDADAAEAMDTDDFERVLLSGVPVGEFPALVIGELPNIPITLRMNGFWDPWEEALDLPPTGVVGPPDMAIDIDIDLMEDAALLLLRERFLEVSPPREFVGVTTLLGRSSSCSSFSLWW